MGRLNVDERHFQDVRLFGRGLSAATCEILQIVKAFDASIVEGLLNVIAFSRYDLQLVFL